MPSITDKFGKASINSDVAIATTVKTTRAAGVNVLEAIDLSKYATDTPVFVVTYKKTTDPVTGVVSITQLRSWKALVNTGANTLTNLTIQPGYADDIGNAVGDFIECIPTSAWENSLIDGIFVGHNPDGSFKKSQLQTDLGNDGRLVDTLDELTSDFVLSGGIWTTVSGLNGTMTALAAYINGYKNTVAAVATRAFTPSKDTYVDVLKDPVTNIFTLVYTEVANGAASPALTAGRIRVAKVVTSGVAITSIKQTGFDGLGNKIKPSQVLTTRQVLNPYCFRAYRAAGATSANAINAKLPVNVIDFDPNNNFDTANNRYTAPVSGIYDVKARFSVVSSSVVGFVMIYVNGVEARRGSLGRANTEYNGLVFNDLIELNAGDYIEAWYFVGAVLGFEIGSKQMYFSGSLVTEL